MFAVSDYLLLVLYFAVLAWIGAYYYKRSSSSRDYFTGGKGFSWLPVAISVIASDTSAITLLGNPGYAYEKDMRLLLYVFGYCVAAWLVIYVFLPFYCRLEMFTAYEYLEKRFDLRVRTVASALFLFIRGSHVAIAMYAPALILTVVTGIPLVWCVVLMGFVTTIYTTLGGIRAVIWTDVVQFGVIMAAIGGTFYLSIGHVTGGLHEVWRLGTEAGKWHLFDFSLDPASSVSFWAMFVGGTTLAVATMGTDQAVLQRFFAARSERECARSLRAYSVMILPFQIALLLIGVCLFAYYSQHPAAKPANVSSDAILGFFAVQQLPRFITVLLIGAVLAASMGVMSAGINSMSTCSIVDFYKRIWRPGRPDISYVRAGRSSTVVWGLLTTIGALYASKLGLLGLAFAKVQGFVGGVMLGIFLLGIFFRRANGIGALWGSLAGMLVVSLVAFFTPLSFFWYGLVGGGVTIAVGCVVSALFKRQEAVPEFLLFQRSTKRLDASADP